MGRFQRAGYMDVSNTVDATDPAAVANAVIQILQACYPALDQAPLFHDFSRLYSGSYPNFRACDVRYSVRLDGHFNGVHRYAAIDGRHLYMDATLENSRGLEAMLAGGAN
jgi:hypothetical protein